MNDNTPVLVASMAYGRYRIEVGELIRTNPAEVVYTITLLSHNGHIWNHLKTEERGSIQEALMLFDEVLDEVERFSRIQPSDIPSKNELVH